MKQTGQFYAINRFEEKVMMNNRKSDPHKTYRNRRNLLQQQSSACKSLKQIRTMLFLVCLLMQMVLLCCACTNGKAHLSEDGDDEVGSNMESKVGEHEIEVNGVPFYYETVGHGKPIILVHGNGGSHEDFAQLSKQLAEAGYLVYTPDSRGQGRNEPLEEYHYDDMAEDMYCFIHELGIEKPAFYGWSDGGIVGLLLEINHPSTLSIMAISGVNLTPEGAGFSKDMLEDGQNPLYQMMLLEPHITPEQLSSITIPVLVTAGENDVILPEHTQLVADSLPDAELVIEKGEDHGSYILNSEKIGMLLLDFMERNDK